MNLNIKKQEEIINQTKDFVKEFFKKENTGHDWFHSYRVWKLSLKIANYESKINPEFKNIDLFLIQLAALLHDVDDWKLKKNVNNIDKLENAISKKNYNKDKNKQNNNRNAIYFLNKLNIDKETINKVVQIINNISFKGSNVKQKIISKEAAIVQDADRLDALGAIGIARCFATGSILNNKIYDPNIKPKQHKSFEDYKKSKTTSINHFYEKLLLLKDRMNTKTARKIAEKRHKFMLLFLDEFFKEWNAE